MQASHKHSGVSNPTNLTLSHTKIALERLKRIQDKILSRTYLFNLCARNLLCLPASFQCKIKKWKMILFRELIYINAMQSASIFYKITQKYKPREIILEILKWFDPFIVLVVAANIWEIASHTKTSFKFFMEITPSQRIHLKLLHQQQHVPYFFERHKISTA